MTSKNGTYVAFNASETAESTQSDTKQYNILNMWDSGQGVNFELTDSDEKTSAISDAAKKEMVIKLENAKQFLLILTKTTKEDKDWLPIEIAAAVDEYDLPLILAYPDFDSVITPAELSNYWPSALKIRIENGSARAIHVPFRKSPVLDAIQQFDVTNKEYPTDGYGFYTKETHESWELTR